MYAGEYTRIRAHAESPAGHGDTRRTGPILEIQTKAFRQ